MSNWCLKIIINPPNSSNRTRSSNTNVLHALLPNCITTQGSLHFNIILLPPYYRFFRTKHRPVCSPTGTFLNYWLQMCGFCSKGVDTPELPLGLSRKPFHNNHKHVFGRRVASPLRLPTERARNASPAPTTSGEVRVGPRCPFAPPPKYNKGRIAQLCVNYSFLLHGLGNLKPTNVTCQWDENVLGAAVGSPTYMRSSYGRYSLPRFDLMQSRCLSKHSQTQEPSTRRAANWLVHRQDSLLPLSLSLRKQKTEE